MGVTKICHLSFINIIFIIKSIDSSMVIVKIMCNKILTNNPDSKKSKFVTYRIP